MECPQCKGYQLEPRELETGLLAGACPKCDGALLSLMNYRYWADQNVEIEPVDSSDIVTEDSSKAKICPKCTRLMTKFQIGNESENRIELCTACDEAWLDKGEWRLLKQLDLQDKLPAVFTDAWQRNIRLQRQQQKLKQHYEEKLGAGDFKKLDEFKQWLDRHPEKIDIKQYLITTVY
jgi:Zn-finger nucleic acid-binding protein